MANTGKQQVSVTDLNIPMFFVSVQKVRHEQAKLRTMHNAQTYLLICRCLRDLLQLTRSHA